MVNNSLLANNTAIGDGGAVLLKNTRGYVSFLSNLFQNNSLSMDMVSGGGAIAATLTNSSIIVFLSNTFYMNSAFIGIHI